MPKLKAGPVYRLTLSKQTARTVLIDKNVCGGAENGTFKYDLEISVSALDNAGFVVDNRVVGTILNLWTDRTYVASCETLAGGLVQFVQKTMPARVTRVVARVYNKTGHAEVIWESGQELPTGPRVPTQRELREEIKGLNRRSC